jgi:hypothetical protein
MASHGAMRRHEARWTPRDGGERHPQAPCMAPVGYAPPCRAQAGTAQHHWSWLAYKDVASMSNPANTSWLFRAFGEPEWAALLWGHERGLLTPA